MFCGQISSRKMSYTSCCATFAQLLVTVIRFVLITHDGQTVYSQQEGVDVSIAVSTFVLTRYTPRHSDADHLKPFPHHFDASY